MLAASTSTSKFRIELPISLFTWNRIGVKKKGVSETIPLFYVSDLDLSSISPDGFLPRISQGRAFSRYSIWLEEQDCLTACVLVQSTKTVYFYGLIGKQYRSKNN